MTFRNYSGARREIHGRGLRPAFGEASDDFDVTDEVHGAEGGSAEADIGGPQDGSVLGGQRT